MVERSLPLPPPRSSARLRLALSYAAFLVVAGFITLFGIYVVLRYVPNYPLTAANPSDADKPIAARGEILEAVVSVSGVVLVALAVIGVVGGWFLAGRVLRPLRYINNAAAVAASGRLDHRIRLRGRNDEFRQLADTFDLMLDRLSNAFETQKRFAANASHELRTPLAVTRTMLDVAQANPKGQDYPVLIERLSITNTRAIGLTEALLRLADANAIVARFAPVDLSGLVETVVAESMAEADSHQVSIETRFAGATAIGDSALLRQLVSNLVHNAIRHNVTGGSAWIDTGLDQQRRMVLLRVQNTGTTYTPEQVAKFTEPFLRGAGRVRKQDGTTTGYGLGLALVSRIVEVHNGGLVLTPRAGGGLVVTVGLPIP